MNIEAYNLDTLRKLVRDLQTENNELKQLIEKNHIPFESGHVFQNAPKVSDEYDPDQSSLIETFTVTDDIANRFFSMFWGRKDVFARRGKNGGYFPQCLNRWDTALCPKQAGQTKHNCASCSYQKYEQLELKHIKQHLLGSRENCTDVIGIYPLLPDNTCRFLVFDFDNHEKGADQHDNANTDELWNIEKYLSEYKDLIQQALFDVKRQDTVSSDKQLAFANSIREPLESENTKRRLKNALNNQKAAIQLLNDAINILA